MTRLFLIGMLCGVMLTAAVTYVFALPANDYHWKMEIWKRGAAAWTFDKDGHYGWKWMIESNTDNSDAAKRAVVPSWQSRAHGERL